MSASSGPDGLPDHQLDVASTLGHANEVMGRLCDLLYDYAQAESLGLTNVFDDALCHVTVISVAPLPPAVPRLAADVLTQLRAAIEHAVFAEVEAAVARELTSRTAGRPARRYYRLTSSGVELARDALARAYRPRRGSVAPFPAPGSP